MLYQGFKNKKIPLFLYINIKNYIFIFIYLIGRVVDIIGKEKAIDFFQKTKEIEENGGMLIMNGSRRRTAGGVYFWLVKNDKHIPQEKIREIFYYDQKETSEQRKKASINDRRQKTQELMKSFESKYFIIFILKY